MFSSIVSWTPQLRTTSNIQNAEDQVLVQVLHRHKRINKKHLLKKNEEKNALKNI